jgi:hypothetical protein
MKRRPRLAKSWSSAMGYELLIQVLLLDVKGVDIRHALRCVCHCAPGLDSYSQASAMKYLYRYVSTHNHACLSRVLSVSVHRDSSSQMQSGRQQKVCHPACWLLRSRRESSSPKALEASSQACPPCEELCRLPLSAFSCLPRRQCRRASASVDQTSRIVRID